jgi:hypothetical protein
MYRRRLERRGGNTREESRIQRPIRARHGISKRRRSGGYTLGHLFLSPLRRRLGVSGCRRGSSSSGSGTHKKGRGNRSRIDITRTSTFAETRHQGNKDREKIAPSTDASTKEKEEQEKEQKKVSVCERERKCGAGRMTSSSSSEKKQQQRGREESQTAGEKNVLRRESTKRNDRRSEKLKLRERERENGKWDSGNRGESEVRMILLHSHTG